MNSFLATGHIASCPVQTSVNKCTCEKFQYVFTGILALFIGLIQVVVGYFYSLSILSDALHAIPDSLADLSGFLIASLVVINKHKEEEIRTIGNKVIALLLFLGALWIIYETYKRYSLRIEFFSPLAAIIVGVLATFIDRLRWVILEKAQKLDYNKTRNGLIAHAKSDMLHSLIVSLVAFTIFTAKYFSLNLIIAPQKIDFILSFILSLYMISLSIKIWKEKDHEHHHVH